MNFLKLVLLAFIFSATACTDDDDPQPPNGYIKGSVLRDSTELLSFDHSLPDNKNTEAEVECTIGRSNNILLLNFSGNDGFGLRLGVQLPGSSGIGEFEFSEEHKPVYTEALTGRKYGATEGEFRISGHQRIKGNSKGKDDYISGSYWLTVPDSTSGQVLRVEVEFVNIRADKI